METIEESLYDYPKYYDLLFGSDWKAEFDFLGSCFQKHAKRPVRRLFEPACGTGRLLVKLADAGFEVYQQLGGRNNRLLFIYHRINSPHQPLCDSVSTMIN